jgi:hypothetical protein
LNLLSIFATCGFSGSAPEVFEIIGKVAQKVAHGKILCSNPAKNFMLD